MLEYFPEAPENKLSADIYAASELINMQMQKRYFADPIKISVQHNNSDYRESTDKIIFHTDAGQKLDLELVCKKQETPQLKHYLNAKIDDIFGIENTKSFTSVIHGIFKKAPEEKAPEEISLPEIDISNIRPVKELHTTELKDYANNKSNPQLNIDLENVRSAKALHPAELREGKVGEAMEKMLKNIKTHPDLQSYAERDIRLISFENTSYQEQQNKVYEVVLNYKGSTKNIGRYDFGDASAKEIRSAMIKGMASAGIKLNNDLLPKPSIQDYVSNGLRPGESHNI